MRGENKIDKKKLKGNSYGTNIFKNLIKKTSRARKIAENTVGGDPIKTIHGA